MDDVGAVSVISESVFTVRDHGVHTAFVEQVEALRRLGVDVAVNRLSACRRASVTIVHTPGPFAFAALAAAGDRGVAVAHVTPDTLSESIRFERWWRGTARMYLRSLYRSASHVVAVSDVVATELGLMGIDPERVIRVPNGVGQSRLQRPRDAEILAVRRQGRPGRPLIIGVGQVQSRKGIGAFAAVAATLPEYDFAWVGGRPFGRLTEVSSDLVKIASQPPANLRFCGRVSDSVLAAHYHAADLFLFPSRQENFGQVVVEAAACGLPLVISDLAVFRENFASGATLASDERLAGEVRHLLQDDEARRRAISGANSIASRFTADSSVKRLLRALSMALPEPVARPSV